jgi:hypothetical protein
MDYLATMAQSPRSEPRVGSLMEFAHEQQRCRYEHVLITPIPQRKGQTEERFLDETESWEALNETWAVFIGWAVWTQLELARSKGTSDLSATADTDLWVRRLQKADKEAELLGYYEPQDPAEKAMAQKRYRAPAVRISAVEIMILMKEVLGSSASRIRRSAQVLGKSGPPIVSSASCTASAVTQ